MSKIEVALIGYVTLTFLMLILIVSRRTYFTLSGRKAANTFSPLGDDLSAFDQRLARAHANCIENLPIFATVALYSIFFQYQAITDNFAIVFLGARIGQTITHVASTSIPAVFIRFTFFAIQLLIMAEWLWSIISLMIKGN